MTTEPKHTPKTGPRCPEGYGVKSLRLLRAAKERGLRINGDGTLTLPTGRVHSGTPQDGRNRVNLSIDGERCTIQTARVVCFLAHGEPDHPCRLADHIDGDPQNDHPDNLRWATYSENLRNSAENRTAEESRIQACLDACAGIPTEQLQAGCVVLMSDAQLLEASDRLENATGCIQGFTHGERHWIRDLSAPRDQQVIWRGNSHTEMMRQIRFHNMKRALAPFQDKPE